jgi:HD-GYP domain-containing protein (c-di-GMP phosphodiesterase class II)
VLEALTADRPYQTEPMPLEGVEAVLTTHAGTQFDDDCVAVATDGLVEHAVEARRLRRASSQVA